MNRRIVTRPVNTDGVAANTLIEKDASEIYWLSVCPHVWNTRGIIQIYDGFDAGGKLVWESSVNQSRHFNFIPPIHCEQGIFVATDEHISCYTIAWRPKKWDRPTTQPLDVIEHSEA